MKFKRNMYIAIVAIALYFALAMCYERFIVKDEFTYVYSLLKSVSRGDKILESDLNKVRVSVSNLDKYVSVYPQDGYYRDDYLEGSMLLNNMILSGDEYIKTKTDNEIISIKLGLAEDAASYQIEKGSIVNIFYSAKLAEIDNIINSINRTSISSNNADNGYVTLKLMEKIKILSCYDKYGNITKKGNVIETILVEVSKDESIKINNLKNYGKFSISVIK